MMSAMQIRSRREEEQMILQTAKPGVILRLETQDIYEARETIPTQGINHQDVSGETENQAAGGEVDGKSAIL
jgi:hypothetical protein